MTTEEFIQKAKAVHGDKYNYSKAEYVNPKTKVCIICPEHGEFLQRYSNHLHGQGCPICGKVKYGRSRTKWTYDKCYKEALKYTSRGEFAKSAQGAYNKALENGWLPDYIWIVPKRMPANYWSYERCWAEAQKYDTRIAFRRSNNEAYSAAYRNGWLSEYTWQKTRFVWTYESCREVAKKYKTKREFEKGHCGAYIAARKNKWLQEFDWFVNNRVNVLEEAVDTVYSYYFEDYNAIYIGRTIKPQRRDHEHIFNTRNDTVARFAHEHHCSVPQMYIIEEGLTLKQGQEREDYWRKYYQDKGYVVLNSARTGVGVGSLGTIGGTKWNREKCYKEALKYKSRNEFRKLEVGAYTRALKKGWMKDYTWFDKPKTGNIRWSKNLCYEEAQKYHTINEFLRGCNYAYIKAKRQGWLQDYTWLVLDGEELTVWTKERCYSEAQKYKTRGEFRKGNYAAYQHSKANGWLVDYSWFVNGHLIEGERRRKWTYETCYEEARKYKSRTAFQYGECGTRPYKVARANGWLDDYIWFEEKRNPSGYWTKDKCAEESKKYSTISEFKKHNNSAYAIAQRNKWLKEFVWLHTKKLWTYEECKSIASQYASRWAFRVGNAKAYAASLYHRWLNDFFPIKQKNT